MRKAFVILLISFVFGSCERKGDLLPNNAPETAITPEKINLSGDDRLNSEVYLSWYGTDKDGFVAGFEISLDNVNWSFTTVSDSLFRFTLNEGSDTTDIDLYVRAVDNDSLRDPTPAYLRIPLKNTPPDAFFVEKAFPEDTVRLVTTFQWDAFDLDGYETIVKAFIKINGGNWFEIDVNQKMISIVPEIDNQQGTTDAFVYYGTENTPLPNKIDGLALGDTNTIYLKVVDLAEAESAVDTSKAVFVKPRTGNVLYVSALPESATAVYRAAFDQVHPAYDLESYGTQGGKYQPKFWAPTFDLLLQHYNVLFFASDQSFFTNPVTGRKAAMLEFAAPSIQLFSNSGGKSFVVTSFTKGQDITGIISTLPIDSISSATGQAYLVPDSAIYSVQGSAYPDMSPTSVLFGLTPFYMSADAEEVYKARLTIQPPWTGPDIVGARRRNQNNNIYQYFFSVQLYLMDKDPNDLPDLFNRIFNDDFVW